MGFVMAKDNIPLNNSWPNKFLSNRKLFWFLCLAALYAVVAFNFLSNKTKDTIGKFKRDPDYKTILFWGTWFGSPWEARFGPITSEELREAGCPTWKCYFTNDTSLVTSADAVLFTFKNFRYLVKYTYYRPPEQRWVFVHVEPPNGANGKDPTRIISSLVNWTMTYHSSSDIHGGFYGYFTSLNASSLPFKANYINEHREPLEQYKEVLESNFILEEIMGPTWSTYVNKSKPLAWMVSNCKGLSGRKEYVDELAKYISIDIYGKCSGRWCLHQNSLRDSCWQQVLSWQYTFYLSFENNLCDDYVSEKLYFPLVYGVVPVVYGGADYTQFLPPNSYINARDYHPRELAALLIKLHNDPVALGRYHLWRAFWKVDHLGSFCHLCHRLHTDSTHHHHTDIQKWNIKNGKCKNPSVKLFNNRRFPNACKAFISTNSSCFSKAGWNAFEP